MKITSIKKYFVLMLIASGFFPLGYCQTVGDFEIEQFRVNGYTNDFKKGLEYDFELSGKIENIVLNGKVSLVQKIGVMTHRFGKEWVGVKYNFSMNFNEVKINVNGVDLYDKKRNLKNYSIDEIDGEITQYFWDKVPKIMKNGETAAVGRFSKRSKNGKIFENGTLTWNFIAAPTGYEFCEIEKSIDVKSKEKSAVRSCDIFDKSRQLVGSYLEIILEDGTEISGSGPVRLR
jgi:hypothetical protein